ncbi:hypothetical protein [Listeria seeligeri]|uniref:hypothetical protein n=1 Tax=Listeria seeligeri TaxID=1640 RepID=UPI0018884D8E|nr:hypothetical protein [Listeria seeligeri]MBF2459316.1 hypothetical protein [Listeria seeligeri]MBF2550028.1 hypothetical protein [Listeria seeligeri]
MDGSVAQLICERGYFLYRGSRSRNYLFVYYGGNRCFQVKATLKINNPKLAVHKSQKKLMYFVISVLVVIVVGTTVFVYPYINDWFSSLTGYAHFLYTGRFFLIPVGTIIFILAVVATILKINAVNQLYFKKVGNEENELF